MTQSPLTAADSPLLSVDGLAFSYRGRQVLDAFSLELRRGEVLGLLGPNGCGKSTALSVISGLRRAPGSVLMQGQWPVLSREYRRRLGVVFQSPSLDNKLSATENLLLTARMHGISGRSLKVHLPQLLTWAGLSERASDLVGTYSGGMKRRLEIARALVHTPDVLLLDEPTTGLDAASFERTWARLADLRDRQDTGIIVATHKPEEAERCDRLLIMDGGRVVRSDTPDNLKREVARDLVLFESDDAAALRVAIAAAGFETTTVDDRTLTISCDRGAQALATVARAVPESLIARLELRPATLADVFLAITGAQLAGSDDTAEQSQ